MYTPRRVFQEKEKKMAACRDTLRAGGFCLLQKTGPRRMTANDPAVQAGMT